MYIDYTSMKNRKLFHTSTLDAKNTHVGAINTGSILLREYLKYDKTKLNVIHIENTGKKTKITLWQTHDSFILRFINIT